ncbi:uncharacterized protein PHALS_15271 [Plasmopara halstedii]|uniref:Uncharacterized protein n=1 Tax=Plasmopara halstedii TaxID=4781 RepID=A0A0P1B6Z0_PLAHL|nr:uncharacterized protein PHALS_15271 [Plasmopara halstedii]CEG50334.1 hypothetical protein PHALS_15271 [Plasmopara halstedii]|eukprot:XP_024586703.1 hypothetical protein PHALS_15271 [Plasmopara halstedii]
MKTRNQKKGHGVWRCSWSQILSRVIGTCGSHQRILQHAETVVTLNEKRRIVDFLTDGGANIKCRFVMQDRRKDTWARHKNKRLMTRPNPRTVELKQARSMIPAFYL